MHIFDFTYLKIYQWLFEKTESLYKLELIETWNIVAGAKTWSSKIGGRKGETELPIQSMANRTNFTISLSFPERCPLNSWDSIHSMEDSHLMNIVLRKQADIGKNMSNQLRISKQWNGFVIGWWYWLHEFTCIPKFVGHTPKRILHVNLEI